MVCSPGLSEHRYGDFLDESLLILECMDEIYGEGDYAGNPFTFPIPTINLTPDITFNEPIWDNILRTTSKYGSYYFMNYRGSGIKSGSKRNMCCRVMLDYDELSSTGGRWAMESSTGSLGIVTLNMARLGYVCRDSNGLLDNLTYLMNRAVESLTIKAGWIRRLQEAGMLPLISRYDIHMERFFYTIGVLGFDELFMNLNGTHIWDNMDQATEILNHMRDWTRERQRELGVLINIEMTPGEEAASKLASRDVEQYPDMYHQGTDEAPYYSTLLTPPSYYMGVMERARIEERLLPLFTGGTVHRIYMGEGQPYHEGLKKITQRIADNTKIPYFDFTATFSVCQSCHGFMPGPHVTCSRCGATNRIYSRITGYYRDMLNSNLGKQQEFWDRKYVSI
jgi:ribonucleoside-triphosphate reductase